MLVSNHRLFLQYYPCCLIFSRPRFHNTPLPTTQYYGSNCILILYQLDIGVHREIRGVQVVLLLRMGVPFVPMSMRMTAQQEESIGEDHRRDGDTL